jgi:broad specificity phosphatase PhoE
MHLKQPRKIFLVRHGRSEWNGRKIISGQLNPLLSAEGKRQAVCLAEVLRGENIGAIHTSSLARTVETARPTARMLEIEIETHDALREINFGVLQGRFRDDRDTEAQELWARRESDKKNFRFPQGENFAELETRVGACLDRILASRDETILLVGHRSTNRVILRRLMNWTRTAAVDLKLRSKYLYEITLADLPAINTIRVCGGTKISGFKE